MFPSVTVVAIIYPLTTLPQVIDIFRNHKADGISVLTWALYLIFTVFFLLYAVRRQLTPLIIGYSLWLVMEGAVVVGAIIY